MNEAYEHICDHDGCWTCMKLHLKLIAKYEHVIYEMLADMDKFEGSASRECCCDDAVAYYAKMLRENLK